jgi:hypothetical protein
VEDLNRNQYVSAFHFILRFFLDILVYVDVYIDQTLVYMFMRKMSGITRVLPLFAEWNFGETIPRTALEEHVPDFSLTHNH